MPSHVLPVWLLLVAAAQADPLSPPPHGRPVEATPLPSRNTGKTIGGDNDAAPTAKGTTKGATDAAKAARRGPKAEPVPAVLEEPAEEIVADAPRKSKSRKKASHTLAADDRSSETSERKNSWTADRYMAVVPPGLTLAALRSQLAKSPTLESTVPATEHRDSPEQTLAEIIKAREALRQETARLEALLKAANNCPGLASVEGSTALSSGGIESHGEASTEQVDSISKAMKGMKPEQGAALLSHLNRGLAADILRRMKASDAGAILGMLKPELAADLATEIATRRPLKKTGAK